MPGVVSNVRQNLMESPLPETDLLMSAVRAEYAEMVLLSTNLLVCTSGDPKSVASTLRTILHEIDPTLPFRTPKIMEEIIGDQLVMQRMESWLFGIFASLAVLLAVVGIYGLVSQEIEMGGARSASGWLWELRGFESSHWGFVGSLPCSQLELRLCRVTPLRT
jgi:putative ABC transport system permease protein